MKNQSNTDISINVLTEKEAAFYIGMSAQYLRADRCNGPYGNRTPGPPWLKIGRAVRYQVADLDEWLKQNLRTHQQIN